jgi:hypothetical protein
MICEPDPVILIDDVPEHGLHAGDLGTVVHVYSGGRGLEVEFFAIGFDAPAVVSLLPTQVRLAASYEMSEVVNLPRSDDAILQERDHQNRAVLQLLRSWTEEGDEVEQQETLAYLKQAIDQDRPSSRKLFPSKSHDESDPSRRGTSGIDHASEGGRGRKDL